MRLLFLFFLILNLYLGYGQSAKKISIGTRNSIYSKVLKEKRELLINLPTNYKSDKKYPVIYLLDGESHFHFFTGVVNILSSTYIIPEMIVVGIVNTNRNRDLTPTHDSLNFDKTNGGGEIFTSFLEKEIIPYVETNFPTAPYRMLVGHSLGGLFVMNTLLHHTSLFNSYISIDPALWWDRMKLVHESSRLLTENNYQGKSLFMVSSSTLPYKEQRAIIKKDTTTSNIGQRAMILFDDILTDVSRTDLRWESKCFGNETHASVPLIGALEGLKFAFDYYKRPTFAVLTDSTATILENHYKKVSEKMGYSILPSESDLVGLAWRSSEMEKNFDRALVFLQLYMRLYPNSPDAYSSMGEFYKAKGELDKAQTYYDKAKALRGKLK